MKKWHPYIILFIVGLVIGYFVCRQCSSNGDKNRMIQRDTVVTYDTIHYTKTEIKTVEVPKKEVEYVYITERDTTIVYRDSVRYIALPKQCYHTKTSDVEIWHSGIESSIDSLNVFQKTLTITQTKAAKNAVSLGIEAGYIGYFHAPVFLQYERRLRPWLSIYGKAEYDLSHKQFGGAIGAKAQIQW